MRQSDSGKHGETAAKALLLQGLSRAHLREWKDAEHDFIAATDNPEFGRTAQHCAYICREGYSYGRKSPTVAGLLAVAPGLGYLYDGYPRTALSAFIINSAFIWGTVEAYRNGRDGLGTLLGVMGIGWYAGNIYGSISSARRHNEQFEKNLLLKLDVGFVF